MKATESGNPLVGRQLENEFSGEWFRGIVVDVGDNDGERLYTVNYEDKDGKTMTAADLAEVLIPEAESGDWETVKHLVGVILEAKVSKTKIGQSRKTSTKALMCVRWDEDL